MIEKNENDTHILKKKEFESPRNDISVNVDNFVEIGDFFGSSGWI